MCLIVFSYLEHPDFPLILAANRDEYHARPTAAMGWWPDSSTVLGGRDLKAGGSWFAVSRSGRLAAVTNVRENSTTKHRTADDQAPIADRSRGEIVSRFVQDNEPTETFAPSLLSTHYAGVNALYGDQNALHFASNRPANGDTAASKTLAAGTFGISNASLDTPWQKTLSSKAALRSLLEQRKVTADELFDVVADRTPAADIEISSAGLPTGLARAASAPFIVTPEYGTRCSTALLWRADGHIEIAERRFGPAGDLRGESRFVFVVA